MNKEVLEHCLRGIVQYLNGDVEKFRKHANKAMEIHQKESFNAECNYSIEDLIPVETKYKLYQMVS